MSQPRAALLAFGVAALAYNILSVIGTAVRIRYELVTSDIELSPYYLASEIRATYAGMMIAVPTEIWEGYDPLTPAQLSRELLKIATHVDPARDVMQPHWERTAERVAQFPVVLCIADTTELNFNGQEREGLGPLSYEAQRGMFLHPTYAVTPGREPLGVIDAWMWAREPKDADGNRGGIKESVRWIEGYERVAEQAALLPQTRLVYVTDREGDIAELMARAQELGQPADWLIRSQHNRNLAEGGKLWDSVDASPVLGEITFILPGRAGQKAREVKQELRARRVKLLGTSRRVQ
ncbi:IS4 family transposase [Cupriavidus sp. LEh21]|nr:MULTISPECIES: IS4 family transposase [unclassified Cupriavidus]MDK2662176.1 IS4 family transposase [Cupriavidus sp. LEh21]